MILVEVIAAAMILSLLTGGSLKRLAGEPLKGEVALLLLLPLQLAWPSISEALGLHCAISIVFWLLMMSGLAVVLMLNASRRWQLAVAALGISANILVIGVNQAMPVSIMAASEVGNTRHAIRAALESDCLHEELTGQSGMPFLADVLAVPGPAWQGGVISVGDILLSFGLGAWVFAASKGEPKQKY